MYVFNSKQQPQKLTEVDTSRPPLVPAKRNNVITSRHPQMRDISSRHRSPSPSPSTTSVLRRCQSPTPSRTVQTTSHLTAKRAQSAERKRPSIPSSPPSPSSTTPVKDSSIGIQISSRKFLSGRSPEGLWPSTMRSLSVSFQSDNISVPVSKKEKPVTSALSERPLRPSSNVCKQVEKPTVARKSTLERNRNSLVGRNAFDQSENSKPVDSVSSRLMDQHRWPSRTGGKVPSNSLARSVDATESAVRYPSLHTSLSCTSLPCKSSGFPSLPCRASDPSLTTPTRGTSPTPARQSTPARGTSPTPARQSTPARGTSPTPTRPSTPDRGVRPILARPSTPTRGTSPAPTRPSTPDRGVRPILARPSTPTRGTSPTPTRPSTPDRGIRPILARPSTPARGTSPTPARPSTPARGTNPTPARSRPSTPARGTGPTLARPSSPPRGISPSRIRSSNSSNQTSSSASVLSFIADFRQGRKSASYIEDAHQLRLVYNRYLQWQFANARANAVLHIKKVMAEKSLYNAWNITLALWDTVISKRIRIQQLRLELKLNSILNEQMSYLDDWALLERDHSSSLSGTVEDFESCTLRLPVTGGARVDIDSLKLAICSALDVMQTLGSSLCLLSRVETTNSLVSQLAFVALQESDLHDQCEALLASTADMQVKEHSLRTHLIQMRQAFGEAV